MVPGGMAAVICNGGVISGAGPPASARAGRAGGAHSRGAVAGRGHCAAWPPRLAGGRLPWPGEPGRLLGIHLIPPLAPPDRNAGDLTGRERAALADLDERSRTGSGYSAEHGTRPQTIGYSLTGSPAGLCAWIVEKLWAWTDHPGDLSQVLTADQVLDNITLYWLTGTGASSARLYWESIAQVTEWFTTATGDAITVPAGCGIFPKEVPRPSRRWAQALGGDEREHIRRPEPGFICLCDVHSPQRPRQSSP
jgi:hypothetical protein